jgi:pimeloyl-ACP methyl ester carboxylesterase
MKVIDRGSGRPVVLLPGVQGRWEWMAPTVDALAKRCRVITFSLRADPLRQIDEEHTSSLVLVSTPGPEWTPTAEQAFYAKYWAIALPFFVVGAFRRMLPEVVAARRSTMRALTWMARHGMRVLTHPASPRQMKRRADRWLPPDRKDLSGRIAARTLVITGERELDRVVPAAGTAEYGRRIPGARVAVLERTGHIGLVTRPVQFAEMVASFVEDD